MKNVKGAQLILNLNAFENGKLCTTLERVLSSMAFYCAAKRYVLFIAANYLRAQYLRNLVIRSHAATNGF